MATQDEDFARRLSELGQKLELKQRDLAEHGILHGDVRWKAVDLKVRQARLERIADAKLRGSPQWTATLSSEFNALKLMFDRWAASIDMGR